MPAKVSRRDFIRETATISTGLTIAGHAVSQADAALPSPTVEFTSQWSTANDRVWLGPEYWANPLQDWRISGGRIECVNAAPDRNVHLLTTQLGDSPGDLQKSVRVGRLDSKKLDAGKGSFGFRFGIVGPLAEYRNNLIFGKGTDVGVTAAGTLFIGDVASAQGKSIELGIEAIALRLVVEPTGNNYTATLYAYDAESGKLLGETSRSNIAADRLVGNVALVANFGAALPAGAGKRKAKAKAKDSPVANVGAGKFWFADWRVAGSKIKSNPGQAFGPILFSQYTLSGRILKLTAQMPPLGEKDSQSVQLQIRDGNSWKTIGTEPIHPEARTATFRIMDWNDRAEVPYRLVYSLRDAEVKETKYYWRGTIRRDPIDQPVLTVANISCNIHAAFPNAGYVANVTKLNPDFLAFVGDQFYESTGGYGVVREPVDMAILDYLRKWYMHGWTWRELTRDRPSISLPDDHDVYQGNVWGESGAARHGTQEMGGYDMSPVWVNVVHRTQTSHHPDPYDPMPIKQNIAVYYGPLTYGRVSFAILADRMFKSGPEGKVPPTQGRGDHVTDPNFQPKTADLPNLELLGARQLKFLRDWATDWRGADMKAVVSQTIFTAMATTHGADRQRLVADYDANGWPQTARNNALREIRKAFAVHFAGDQHLPAVVHYGVDRHRDAGVAFAGPAVNVGYPRWWEPSETGKNRRPGAPENTGDFLDHFGHPLTVLAVANGAVNPRGAVLEMLRDKASGLGLIRFDKPNRKITFECWPFLADPISADQFPGWPMTISMLDNYGRQAVAHLPRLVVQGAQNPVLQIIEERSGEMVYTLRMAGREFQPHVFAAGTYTIKLGEPGSAMKELKGIEAAARNDRILEINV